MVHVVHNVHFVHGLYGPARYFPMRGERYGRARHLRVILQVEVKKFGQFAPIEPNPTTQSTLLDKHTVVFPGVKRPVARRTSHRSLP